MNSDNITQIYQDMQKMIDSNEPISNFSEHVSLLGDSIEEIEKVEKKDLSELALNYWRLFNWVSRSNADKKTIAHSALKRIKSYLEKNQIELMDLTGQKYDDGYAADVLGVEAETDASEEDLIVCEMVKPIILFKGSVIKYGQVILGDTIKRESSDTSSDAAEGSRTDTLNICSESNIPKDVKEKKERNIIIKLAESVKKLLGRRGQQ